MALKHLTAAITALLAWLAGLPDAVWLLAAVQLVDIVTGVLAAQQRRELCSQRGISGICRKTVMWLLVGMAYLVQHRAHLDAPIGDLSALYYASFEGMSVLENAGRLGCPIPGVLRRSLLALRRAADDREDTRGTR